MRKVVKNEVETKKMMADTNELQAMFGCGRASAVRIGTEANAKVKIGRRVFWNLKKISDTLMILVSRKKRQNYNGNFRKT